MIHNFSSHPPIFFPFKFQPPIITYILDGSLDCPDFLQSPFIFRLILLDNITPFQLLHHHIYYAYNYSMHRMLSLLNSTYSWVALCIVHGRQQRINSNFVKKELMTFFSCQFLIVCKLFVKNLQKNV